ncbi:GTP pyrophosphokinase [Oxalicibacterium faecigallinarum]|uniref:(P)ppGpp synthetase n=1 Tax=Oxalicibacterium faecigallinarum TaxID=573741 RepID=A0A8J3ARS0_9BURK|nr:(p)ppGpp synthetase [Oxalicibacterium faecigallinarum]GGI18479.1 (p)ppGpp synthetase [Oxalicibacterium faecigallinarum]
MASLDFEHERKVFAEYHESHFHMLQDAGKALVSLLNELLINLKAVPISKVESRIKSCNECIWKFELKYLHALEETGTSYSIKDHIDDLIGLRIVCLYEDDIEKIGNFLETEFDVLNVTDKITSIEMTEGSFGYKGLHFDLKLNASRSDEPEFQQYRNLRFEVQVRTIIQDSWSVLDHQIKYKRSIPNHLKRRINTLAALFELADREFRHIRDSTLEEMEKVEIESSEHPIGDAKLAVDTISKADSGSTHLVVKRGNQLNAFSFLKIATHFFPAFDFEPQKVDGFVQQILAIQPSITRSEFNQRLLSHISFVKRYQSDYESKSHNRMNPYTIMRHCLYLGDSSFQAFLSDAVRKNFETWIGTR